MGNYKPKAIVSKKRRPSRAERKFNSLLRRALKGSKREVEREKILKRKVFKNTRHKIVHVASFYLPTLKLVFDVNESKRLQTYSRSKIKYFDLRGIKYVRFTDQ